MLLHAWRDDAGDGLGLGGVLGLEGEESAGGSEFELGDLLQLDDGQSWRQLLRLLFLNLLVGCTVSTVSTFPVL